MVNGDATGCDLSEAKLAPYFMVLKQVRVGLNRSGELQTVVAPLGSNPSLFKLITGVVPGGSNVG
jgi:hypothetical protein